MTYALRFYVNDELTEKLETTDIDVARERFRALVAADDGQARVFAVVNAEPGPFPVRSFTVMSYQHGGRT